MGCNLVKLDLKGAGGRGLGQVLTWQGSGMHRTWVGMLSGSHVGGRLGVCEWVGAEAVSGTKLQTKGNLGHDCIMGPSYILAVSQTCSHAFD